MDQPLHITGFTARFTCLADRCEDTCCKGWGMQVDTATRDKYAKDAPQLLDALDSGEADIIMKRDPQTDYCIKFEGGLCGVHRDYGTSFLGDACHFYPRITRTLGDVTSMTASLSCPEITRLALFEEAPGWEEGQTDRVPYSLKDYLPSGLGATEAWAVHTAFLNAAMDAELSPGHALARIVSVSHSLENLPLPSWPQAVPFYLRQADARLPVPEYDPADTFNLLHALLGLLSAAKPSARARLWQTINEMTTALGVQFDEQTRELSVAEDSYARWQEIEAFWRLAGYAANAPLLRRWLHAQLTMMLFPFSGFGETLSERATLLGVRYGLTRLALMCASHRTGGPIPMADVVRIVQSLSRFLDHLADPALLRQICAETGWLREARLRALIGDGGMHGMSLSSISFTSGSVAK